VPRRLHIGFVLEWFPPHIGGAETLFDELTKGLVRKGYKVTVVTTWLKGSPRKEIREGVRIVRVRTPDFLHRYLFTVLAVPTAVIALRDVDLIHTTTYNAALPGWIAARVHRISAILTVHEVWAEQWHRISGMGRLAAYGFRAFEWFVLHLPFEKYICSSHFSEGRLQSIMGVEPQRTAVAYPPIDYEFWKRVNHRAAPLREELGVPDDAFLYLYFGRPGVSKGVEHLLDAAVQVRAACPNSRLVLVLAQDPIRQYQRIRQRAAALGLDAHVVFLDPLPREQLPAYLLAADCICVPSISEGFGYSAVEASALGCTVVTTRGHSVEEVIPTGAIFVPAADPTSLADALLRVQSGERPPSVPPPAVYHLTAHTLAVEGAYAGLDRSGNGLRRVRRRTTEGDASSPTASVSD